MAVPTKAELSGLEVISSESSPCNFHLKSLGRAWMQGTQERVTYFRQSDSTTWLVEYFKADGYDGFDESEHTITEVVTEE